MGGGGSKPPRYTENEQAIDQMENYFTKELTYTDSSQLESTVQQLKREYDNLLNSFNNAKGLAKIGIAGKLGKKKEELDNAEKKLISAKSNVKTDQYMVVTDRIFSASPEHGREADKINWWKNRIETLLPNLIAYKKITLDNEGNIRLIERIVDRLIDKVSGTFLNDVNVQLNTITYYNNTKLAAGFPIDKKYNGMINISLNNLVAKNLNGSLRNATFYNYEYNFLKNKILSQLQKHGIIQEINDENGKNFLIFLNLLVKIIEDKDLGKYADGTDNEGIDFDGTFTDEDLNKDKIFEDLDSFKMTCKIFLFLYRKNICDKYIVANNKLTPNFNTFRKCKISGFEPINKPPEEIQRLKKIQESEEEGESTDITDENRLAIQKAQEEREKRGERFTENFQENNIFKQVFNNLKLVFGYILVLIIIGILIMISPTVFNMIHNFVINFLIPVMTYLLTVIGQIVAIVGKSLFMAGEGLFFFIVALLTPIFNILNIIIGMSTDLLKNIFISVMSIFGLSTSTLASKTGESTITLFGVSGKMFGELGSVGASKIGEFTTLLFDILIKAPGIILGNFSKVVFDNSKKIYMTINNIEE